MTKRLREMIKWGDAISKVQFNFENDSFLRLFSVKVDASKIKNVPLMTPIPLLGSIFWAKTPYS